MAAPRDPEGVPSVEKGLRSYSEVLGPELLWRNHDLGQPGCAGPGSETEIVPTAHQRYQPPWLVSSALEAGGVIAQRVDR